MPRGVAVKLREDVSANALQALARRSRDHERFTSLMIEARAELNEDRRRELYVEMQQILRDQGGALIPMFGNDVPARSDQVAHGDLASDRGFDGRRIISRWWLV